MSNTLPISRHVPTERLARGALCIAALSAVALACFAVRGLWFIWTTDYGFDKHGTVDFIQYWTALQLLLDGISPYEHSRLFDLQRPLGVAGSTPVIMWNPPWLLTFLWPVLLTSFTTSAATWFVVNIFLVGLVAAAASRIVATEQSRVPFWQLLPFALAFAPYLDVFYWGQLGLLLGLGGCLLIAGMLTGSAWRTAIGGLILSVKPHLFVLLFLFVGFKLIIHRRFTTIALAVLFWALSVAAVSVFCSSVLWDWLSIGLGIRETEFRGLMTWHGSNPSQWLKDILVPYSVPPQLTLGVSFMLGAALCLVSANALSKGRLSEFDALAHILCFSVLFSPYGWYSDQPVLLVPYLLTVSYLWSSSRRWSLILLCCLPAFQLAMMLLPYWGDGSQSSPFLRIHSAVICMLYFGAAYAQRKSNQEPASELHNA